MLLILRLGKHLQNLWFPWQPFGFGSWSAALSLCRFYVTVTPGPWFPVSSEVCRYAACPTWLRNEAVTHPSCTHAAKPVPAAILPNNREDISKPTEQSKAFMQLHTRR